MAVIAWIDPGDGGQASALRVTPRMDVRGHGHEPARSGSPAAARRMFTEFSLD